MRMLHSFWIDWEISHGNRNVIVNVIVRSWVRKNKKNKNQLKKLAK
jgi:hypothetical protein